MFEIEQKYRIRDSKRVQAMLLELGMIPADLDHHCDTYYNHPCRDFAESKEALRVRRVNEVPYITYKGPKLPGEIKARRELEWILSPGDDRGDKTEQLLTLLGFHRVAEVKKIRQSFDPPKGELDGFVIVLDEVEQLGQFAEIERMARNESEVEKARAQIQQLATRLGLDSPEPRSYLRMLLENIG
ncbi:class IV adenylate cyclase [Novipirellula artificiosorum]|uniref:CYTH domain protein n=1 Tax=Novipirellula artificiosorum TaxID=2528016 RepID=A0A5C6DKD9_9BACT|nr:class IV adenylate cyclase [Novipirellula artificiosorum]TWU37320.1 CYTH domain protein [Novipirellula artificiosorum]